MVAGNLVHGNINQIPGRVIEIRHSNSHSVKAKCHSNPRTTSSLVDACHVKAKFKTEIPSIVLVS